MVRGIFFSEFLSGVQIFFFFFFAAVFLQYLHVSLSTVKSSFCQVKDTGSVFVPRVFPGISPR